MRLHNQREGGRETEGGRQGARGNRFSRPGQAVGKEGSCRGKAEMSQDIPLWLHRAGQIQTFLQLFCVLRLELKSILWVEGKHQHLCIPTDTGMKLYNIFLIVMLRFFSGVWMYKNRGMLNTFPIIMHLYTRMLKINCSKLNICSERQVNIS